MKTYKDMMSLKGKTFFKAQDLGRALNITKEEYDRMIEKYRRINYKRGFDREKYDRLLEKELSERQAEWHFYLKQGNKEFQQFRNEIERWAERQSLTFRQDKANIILSVKKDSKVIRVNVEIIIDVQPQEERLTKNFDKFTISKIVDEYDCEW